MDWGEMDTQWAESVLLRWLDLVEAARAVSVLNLHGLFVTTDRREAAALASAEAQARDVVARIIGQRVALLNNSTSTSAYEIATGEKTVRYALGKLRTDAETRAHLGTAAPSLSADTLHPLIWSVAAAYWDSGHRRSAVQAAATRLSGHVQDRLDRHDLSDSQLMTAAFSAAEAKPGNPRLRWPGRDDDQTVRSMRSGLLKLAPGVFETVRNPASHHTDEIDRQEALESLALLSRLAHWIDACEVVSA